MQVGEYKITYRDGSTQVVRAARQLAEDPWLVFHDEHAEVLRVQTTDIESVQRGDVSDRVRVRRDRYPR
jgi:hypothetical protein